MYYVPAWLIVSLTLAAIVGIIAVIRWGMRALDEALADGAVSLDPIDHESVPATTWRLGHLDRADQWAANQPKPPGVLVAEFAIRDLVALLERFSDSVEPWDPDMEEAVLLARVLRALLSEEVSDGKA